MLTDSHAHIHMKPLCDEAEAVIDRAKAAGLGRIITIGVDYADSQRALALARRYPQVYCAVGVHPHDSAEFSLKDLGAFEALATADKVLAIGEVGLDYYRNHSPVNVQQQVFRLMIDLALSADKPLIIHSREAAEDTVAILSDMAAEHPILLHCFSGDKALLDWALPKENVFFSFAGNLTYPKAVILHEACQEVPIDRLFIETDCPYLAPVPLRGKQNEPANIIHTAKYVADAKNMSMDELTKVLEKNLVSFFKLNGI